MTYREEHRKQEVKETEQAERNDCHGGDRSKKRGPTAGKSEDMAQKKTTYITVQTTTNRVLHIHNNPRTNTEV